MIKYFSQEQKRKRIEKKYKMGRVRFSVLNSLFFALGVTVLASLFDIGINKLFGDPNRLSEVLSYKTLFKFAFMFAFWFVFAYNYLWREIVKYYKENIKDENK